MRRQIARVAEAVGKPTPEVVVDAAGVRLAADRLRPFWLAFSHLVRNAVDHGLEDPDTRAAAGKSPAGRIELRARLDDGAVSIEIADDGYGNRVGSRSRTGDRRRSSVDSQADLEHALFGDGVSTADATTQRRGAASGSLRFARRFASSTAPSPLPASPARHAVLVLFPLAPMRSRAFTRASSGLIGLSQELNR